MLAAMNPKEMIVTGLVFLLVLSLWGLGVLWWMMKHGSRQSKIQRRLELPDMGQGEARTLSLWHEGRETQLAVSGNDRGLTLIAWLKRLPVEAGWNLSLQSMLLGVGGAMAGVGAVGWIWTGRVIVTLAAMIGVVMVFWIYARRCAAKREALFDRQLMDGMQLIARSLRAGHPLAGAFHFVSDEMEPPLSHIFANICEQQSLGVSMDTALRKIAASTHSSDMKLFATSVATQMHSGGNLADMMDRLSAVIRDRIRLSQRIRVLVAQTEFSKRCLMAMPFFVFLMINAINPEYMEPLYATPIGRIMLGVTIGNLMIGSWMMNWLSKLRY